MKVEEGKRLMQLIDLVEEQKKELEDKIKQSCKWSFTCYCWLSNQGLE